MKGGQHAGCVVHMDFKVPELMVSSRIEKKVVSHQDASGRFGDNSG